MRNDARKVNGAELNSIIEKLSNKNLERLLWCAQGLSTNGNQRKFEMFKLNGKHPHLGEMTPCVTIGNLLFVYKNTPETLVAQKSELSESGGKTI